jgi:hypothetical protein
MKHTVAAKSELAKYNDLKDLEKLNDQIIDIDVKIAWGLTTDARGAWEEEVDVLREKEAEIKIKEDEVVEAERNLQSLKQ